MTLKQNVYQHYQQLLLAKVARLEQVLSDLKDSSANETKSTAGDKHETALAMLQIEQANVGKQMEELKIQAKVLENINPLLPTKVVGTGSLVLTNRGYFFISTALGRAKVEEKTVMAISAQSPLGQKLWGLKPGDTIELNGNEFNILTVM